MISSSSPRLRMLLVRHLPTDMPSGHCYGRLDLAPGQGGDPRLILAALPEIRASRLFSSPARRCLALAETLSAATGLPVTPDPRLLELDFGEWEGQPWEAVPREALDRWAADPWGFAPPGGESGAALVARLRSFHAELRADAIIVSHGGPLKVLRQLLGGEGLDLLQPAQPMGSVVMAGAARM